MKRPSSRRHITNYVTPNASAYSTGEWYSLIGTYDGEYERLYVNDELAAETEKSGAISYASDATLMLGACYNDSENYGLIGALAVIKIKEATTVASPPSTATPAPTLTPVPTVSSAPTLTPVPTALVDEAWFRWQDPPEDVATAGWVDSVGEWTAVSGGPSDPTYSASGDGSVVFDGSARLLVASANASHLPSATISVAATVRVDARAETWGAAVSFVQVNGDNECGWVLGWDDSNFVFSVSTDEDGVMNHATSNASAYSTGEWYSLTGTYDGEYMRLYVNDELTVKTEKTGAISYASDATLTLGAHYDANEEYGLIGALAAVSIGEATAVASPASPDSIEKLWLQGSQLAIVLAAVTMLAGIGGGFVVFMYWGDRPAQRKRQPQDPAPNVLPDVTANIAVEMTFTDWPYPEAWTNYTLWSQDKLPDATLDVFNQLPPEKHTDLLW